MSEKNNSLELYVANKFKQFFPNSRPTKNSGGSTEQGDILNPDWHIECKVRNTKNFSIMEDVWVKTYVDCPYNKTPIYFIQNKNHKRLAILDIDDYFSLLEEIESLKTSQESVT